MCCWWSHQPIIWPPSVYVKGPTGRYVMWGLILVIKIVIKEPVFASVKDIKESRTTWQFCQWNHCTLWSEAGKLREWFSNLGLHWTGFCTNPLLVMHSASQLLYLHVPYTHTPLWTMHLATSTPTPRIRLYINPALNSGSGFFSSNNNQNWRVYIQIYSQCTLVWKLKRPI